MSEVAVETQGLSKRYGETVAVEDLNLTVNGGRVVALVGPNGAGKSTAMKMLMGLVRPSAGRIKVLGHSVEDSPVAVRQQVGYVPEDDAVYGWMTVQQALGLVRSLYPRWDQEAVTGALKRFGLSQRQQVADMSRGMRRQLTITLAVAIQPRLLILDEPTAGLDPERKRDFFAIMVDQVAQRETAVLISSHQLHEIEPMVDEVAFIRRGRLQSQTDLDDLKLRQRQVRVVFQNAPPPDLAQWPGVDDVEVEGRSCVIHAAGDVDAIVARLRSHHPFAIDVVDKNLEEIYFTLGEEENSRGKPDGLGQ